MTTEDILKIKIGQRVRLQNNCGLPGFPDFKYGTVTKITEREEGRRKQGVPIRIIEVLFDGETEPKPLKSLMIRYLLTIIETFTTNVKCPVCGSRNLLLSEIWKNHSIQWSVVHGCFDRSDGQLEPGYPYKVEAECECGHRWTVKKATQIDNVIIK